MYQLSILVALFFLAGCGSQAVYDNIQLNNRRECEKLPPAQYEECMARASKSYEEYERDREEAVGK